MVAFIFFVLSFVLAVPTEVTYTGRIADSAGDVLQGSHSLDIALYRTETGGSAVWEMSRTVQLSDGVFAIRLGAPPGPELDLASLGEGIWIETRIDGGGPVGARQPLTSVPYARITDAVATVEPECDTGSVGRLYFDMTSSNLRICDGEEFLRVQACSDYCLPLDEVSCGESVTTGCGESCPGVGTGLDQGECGLAASFECNQSIADTCGNDCGYAGSGLAPSQCEPADAVTCGEAVADDCGNDCGYQGSGCGPELSCVNGECLACSGPCCGLDVGEDLQISVAELNTCLQAAGAAFYGVQYIEVAYGNTSYLDNVCSAFGYSTYAGTYGGDQCNSSARMYPSYCSQGWLGAACNNGCGNTNYPGFRCNP